MAYLTSWLFTLAIFSSLVSILAKADIVADAVITVGPRAPAANVVASIPTCEITGTYSLSWGENDITSWIGPLPTGSGSDVPSPPAFSCTTNP